MDMNAKTCAFGLLLILMAAVLFPPNLHGEERVHIVQRGETFFSIARSYGIRAEDLMRHNGITDPNRLLLGQRLRIPGTAAATNGGASRPPAPAASSGGLVDYRVVRGDTLFGIGRRFSLAVGEIRDINSLSENHVLREGDVLRLPRGPSTNALPASTQAAQNSSSGAGLTMPITSMRWPVAAQEVNYMTGKLNGVVITGVRGEPVTSLTRGTVLSAGPYRGFGRVVIIQVDGGYIYVYGGCESLYIKEGDRVGPGTVLGRLGVDAVSNRPQLFFMVYRGNAPIDPAHAPRA